MTTREEIHDRIQNSRIHTANGRVLFALGDMLSIFEALNDKLAGIEERLRSIENTINTAMCEIDK